MELVSINKKDSKDLIYKSNSLVNSKYNITVVQARFIAFISSFINAYDTDFFTYKINTSVVLDFLGVERKNIKWLSSTLKQLQTTLICLQDDDIAEEYTTFLSHFRLDKKNDVLEFSFHSSIKDCYIQLKNNFTKKTAEARNAYSEKTGMRPRFTSSAPAAAPRQTLSLQSAACRPAWCASCWELYPCGCSHPDAGCSTTEPRNR